MRRVESREEVLLAGPDVRGAFARARDLLWRYRSYPSSIVSGELASPVVGVVIEQTIRAGPLRFRGPVRIVDVWDTPTRCGYRYEALPGHAERGWAEFDLFLAPGPGELRFRVAADAEFAHWLARLGGPIARWHRAQAVDGAFARMRAAAVASRGDAPERAGP